MTSALVRFTERAIPVNFTGTEWEAVLLEAGWSKNVGENGRLRYYPADVVRAAESLIEGLAAQIFLFGDKMDHLPDEGWKIHPDGYASNIVGFYKEGRYGKFKRPDKTEGEGLQANLHILEGHKWLRESMLDAWKEGQTRLYQFSIDAKGETKVGIIEGKPADIVTKITKLSSTDVVSHAAAGGSLLRLVASAQDADVLGLVKEHRPTWLEGFDGPDEGQDHAEYAIRVFEANYAKALDELDKMDDADKDRLAEQSRGVKALASAIRLLRAGKTQEAVELFQKWIAVHPVDTNGSSQAQPTGLYSFPYADQPPADAGANAPTRQVASAQEDPTMSATEQTPAAPAAEPNPLEKRLADLEAGILRRERALQVRERVSESGLKKPAQERILEQLDGKLPDVTDEMVDTAIQTERDYIASLQEAAKPSGLGAANDPVIEPANVEVGKEKYDRYVKAFLGYFRQENVDGVSRFHTLKEAYAEMTPRGWDNPRLMGKGIWLALHQAVPRDNSLCEDYKEHVSALRETWPRLCESLPKRLKESIATADFPTAFGDSLQIQMQKAYTDDPRQDYKEIVSTIVEPKDLNNPFKIFRVGAFKDLEVVAEKAAYQELTPTTLSEESASLTAEKRGGVVIISMEAVLADREEIIRTMPTRMGKSAIRTLQKAVWNEIEANVTLPATGNALVSAGHNNIVALALTYPNLITAVQLMRNQTELDSLEKIGLIPKILWVPVELEDEGVEILESTTKIVANDDATTRSYLNRLGIIIKATTGLGRTAGTQNRAFLMADKNDAESIALGFVDGKEEPEVMLQSPMDTPTAGDAFASDILTYKIRHMWGLVTIDFRFIVGLIP